MPSGARAAAPSPSAPSCPPASGGRAAVGVGTSGTIARLPFPPAGEQLKRGEAFGSLEAAKFVGPLVGPLSGTVTAANDAVVVDPSVVERDPYGAGWLVELD